MDWIMDQAIYIWQKWTELKQNKYILNTWKKDEKA